MTPRRLLALLCALLWAAGCAPISEDEDTDQDEGAVIGPRFAMTPGVERRVWTKPFAETKDRVAASVRFRNAYWLARLSELSYRDEEAFRMGVTALGIPNAHVSKFRNTCTGALAYYVESTDLAIVAFRGTEPTQWNDVKTDITTNLDRTGWFAGRTHRGFVEQLQSIWWANLRPTCEQHDGLAQKVRQRFRIEDGQRVGGELYFTGHSLGGALATLALAEALKQSIPVSAVYTFGAPKVGDAAFGEWLVRESSEAGTATYRFVYKDDLVPGVPRVGPASREGRHSYRHFSAKGEGEAAYQVWFDDDRAVAGKFVFHALWSILDHDIGKYASSLERISRTNP